MFGRRNLSIAAAVVLMMASIVSLWRRPSTELVFVAVGQGDCAFFHSAERTVLIDTGPASAAKSVLSELRKRGIRRLDLVLLSHPDADHIAALPEISRRIPVARVVVPAYFKGHPDLRFAFLGSGMKETAFTWLAGPSEAQIGEFGIRMDVPPWTEGMPDNDGSMMVRIASGLASATFSGDGGFEEEVQMMKRGSWSSQILKLGHHGSRYSSGDSWLDHVHPELAIVSCGRDNAYGHPTQEVLDKCATRGISVLRTDRQGTLTFGVRDGRWVRK